MEETIYFDNAATTFPKPEAVYERMDWVNRNAAVNAGRGSYALAKEATKTIDHVRHMLLALVNGQEVAEVVLSPSSTIAANQVICGQKYKETDVVYVSSFEHNAIMRPLFQMQKQYGFTIQELPCKGELHEIDLEKTEFLYAQNKPDYLYVNHMSNVTGYILPVEQLSEMAKEHGGTVVIDVSQSLGLLEVNMKKLKADYIIFAGHKNLYGSFGTGGFFLRHGMELLPYIAGGTGSDSLNLAMPKEGTIRYEAASPNVVALAGLEAALEEIEKDQGVLDYKNHEQMLTKVIKEEFQKISGVKLYLPPEETHIGMVAFQIAGYQASEVGMILDEDYHIAVRTGYHCAPLIHKLLKDQNNGGVVRASVGRYTTMQDVDKLIKAVKEIALG